MINYEKLAGLYGQDEFAAKAAKCDTMEAFNALFNEYGMDMSLDETAEVITKLVEHKDAQDNGELCDTELDEVAGGGILSGLTAFFHAASYTDCCGARHAVLSFRLFRRTVCC